MTPCGQNYVTPTMIKKGQMEIGDRIQFEEDVLVSALPAEEVQPVPAPGQPDTMRRPASGSGSSASASYRPVDIESLPLIFEQMTNYANTISNTAGDTPVFSVPSHPLVPPEYDQNVDYDSVQYMNGFLRTQIGRSVMVQQLIGSGNTVDRYGFLVGVGNNYLLLQDITNGNILLIDFYTVKYVYIYYSQPVFPSFRPAEKK